MDLVLEEPSALALGRSIQPWQPPQQASQALVIREQDDVDRLKQIEQGLISRVTSFEQVRQLPSLQQLVALPETYQAMCAACELKQRGPGAAAAGAHTIFVL